ncbi:hypothetical protein ELQ87_27270 [Streptomyces griseoviridis]|uniref:Uncharacterized protein n=1 Tax=Streptomyces griseoviridis TaxID=45398 RepID=A0A3Q9KR14_STRGD|nr:hypothetical protein ELQ87_27270 [Streptomyces griseoviridis]QCN85641.1 hypothetical protein DDJ31_11995 [Streptomyces griseoviridis]
MRGGFAIAAARRAVGDRVGLGLLARGAVGGVRPGGHGEFTDRRAAAGTGEGAVEVPSARVAVVHDAGRLGSARGPCRVRAVKVLWEPPGPAESLTEINTESGVETVMCSTH